MNLSGLILIIFLEIELIVFKKKNRWKWEKGYVYIFELIKLWSDNDIY